MTKNKISCSHCFLGVGYTSIIASHLLKLKGIDPIVVDISPHKTFFDLRLSQASISPIPIFPVLGSYLSNALKLAELFPISPVETSYSELNNFHVSKYEFSSHSFAEFIGTGQNSLFAFCLSLKQWSSAILMKPFMEVQWKIKRQYLSGNANSRIGYHNGFTLYYHFLQKTKPNIQNCKTIQKIDYKNKIIFTDSHELHFEKLISTIPIDQLFDYCGFQMTAPLSYQGSYFLYFHHGSSFNANKLIYDCDLASDILRVFTATDKLIVVQLPSYKKGEIKIPKISKRLKELMPTLKDLKFEGELFLPISYPIEPITDSRTLEFINLLKENSVLPFGRFGNWQYSDLHELNWEGIV